MEFNAQTSIHGSVMDAINKMMFSPDYEPSNAGGEFKVQRSVFSKKAGTETTAFSEDKPDDTDEMMLKPIIHVIDLLFDKETENGSIYSLANCTNNEILFNSACSKETCPETVVITGLLKTDSSIVSTNFEDNEILVLEQEYGKEENVFRNDTRIFSFLIIPTCIAFLHIFSDLITKLF